VQIIFTRAAQQKVAVKGHSYKLLPSHKNNEQNLAWWASYPCKGGTLPFSVCKSKESLERATV